MNVKPSITRHIPFAVLAIMLLLSNGALAYAAHRGSGGGGGGGDPIPCSEDPTCDP